MATPGDANPGRPQVPKIVTSEFRDSRPPSQSSRDFSLERDAQTLFQSPSEQLTSEGIALAPPFVLQPPFVLEPPPSEEPSTPPRHRRQPSDPTHLSPPGLSLSPPDRLSPPPPRSSSNGSLHSSPSSPTAGDYLLRVPSHTYDGSSISTSSPRTPPGSPGGPQSYVPPPSPTLSHSSSVHFHTSVDLRKNHPTEHSGAGSYGMLDIQGQGHKRKASIGGVSIEGMSIGEGSVEGRGSRTMGRSPSMGTMGGQSLFSGETRPSSRTGTTTEADHELLPNRRGDGRPPQHPTPLDASAEIEDPTPFEFRPVKLASLVDPKDLDLLTSMGGVAGLAKGLGTSLTKGLSNDSLGEAAAIGDGLKGTELKRRPSGPAPIGPAFGASLPERERVYGKNILPVRKSKSLLLLMWLALKDKVLVILSVAAVVSLALGLYQDLGTPATVYYGAGCPAEGCTEPRVDWVEGVAIVVAIVIVVMVGSLNDWQKERQFKKLNQKKEDRTVKVIRSGIERVINVKHVQVGDICLLEPGEILPVDGVFLRGHNVRCDESGATGESDAIRKYSYDECLEEKNNLGSGERAKKDCFMISGSKVLEGVGEYLVIAVGMRSFHGRILISLSGEAEATPLQSKLNDLAELIAKLGSFAGALLFAVLMIKFFVQLKTEADRSASEKAQSFIQILIISVTLVVVAVPEGLPLAVTLALAFATKRMTSENLLVRALASCETMANASVVCTDKTGTLTTNVMSVVAGSIGVHAKFVRNLQEHGERATLSDTGVKAPDRHCQDFAVDLTDLGTVVREPLRTLFADAINVNSTAFEDTDTETGTTDFVGSKTETALMRCVQQLGWGDDYRKARDDADIIQMVPFSSERKAMGVVVKLADGRFRFYVKGASEVLTKKCTKHVKVCPPEEQDQEEGSADEPIATLDMTNMTTENIQRTIMFYANQSLRTIAICYRDFDSWPPQGMESIKEKNEVPYSALARHLTLIAITGIEDPLREGVPGAVAECSKAGVSVKMCTGDNVLTARSIAAQCGIFTAGGIIMEGPRFRRLGRHDLMEIVPRLQVLARSSPEDKKILVSTLRSLGEIVGVTGDGTNDGPALKAADVGFSMGITGTEVAKEASDIILMDDNFTSIVKAIMWGRCVNDAVRKFLQFQITVNVVAVIVTFITAAVSGTETSALTAVQLLWINIIMDTFAALALATDPATPDLLERKPDRRDAPLFSVDMIKMIVGQSAYQTVIVLVFHFAGNAIFGYNSTDQSIINTQSSELNTLVFNAFVFCQIFNSINCRRLDNRLDIWRGLFTNYFFIGITLLEVVVQIIIVFVGGAAFQVAPLNGRDWGISLALGILSIPLGALIRLIPNGPVQKFLIKIRAMKYPNQLPQESPERQSWNPAIDKVRDNLDTFAKIRGGRMRGSSFVAKSRSAQLSEAGIQTSSIMAMIPTLVLSSVGAGWQPNQTGSMSDPATADPSKSSAALVEEGILLHPDTDKNDPLYLKWGQSSSDR